MPEESAGGEMRLPRDEVGSGVVISQRIIIIFCVTRAFAKISNVFQIPPIPFLVSIRQWIRGYILSTGDQFGNVPTPHRHTEYIYVD